MERNFHKMKSAFLYVFVSSPPCYPGCCITGRKMVIRKIYDVDVGSIIKMVFIVSTTYFQKSNFCLPRKSR